jgi:alkanesulfonate monooxygenase
MAHTESFVPLVAVQPLDMSPFAAARAIATLRSLFERPVDVNFVSGGFRWDLVRQGDQLDHDARYLRLAEYAGVVKLLLAGRAVTRSGPRYTARGLQLDSALVTGPRSRLYVSGSSEASIDAAESLELSQLSYPLPPATYADPGRRRNRYGSGIRIGIMAREDSSVAWAIARQRFPVHDNGSEMHQLVASVTESSWQRDLASAGLADDSGRDPYWLVPFQHFHTFCPHLVGSYDEVATALGGYLSAGVRTIILDVPSEPDDLFHAQEAIRRAASRHWTTVE